MARVHARHLGILIAAGIVSTVACTATRTPSLRAVAGDVVAASPAHAAPPTDDATAALDTATADATRPIVALGAGSDHTCFARDGGFVWCRGRLHDADGPRRTVEPWLVDDVADAVQLVGGAGFACARLGDATVRCWGRGDLGQHGDGRHGDDVPTAASAVHGLDDAVDLDATALAACAARTTGEVVCWGELGMSRLVAADRLVADEPIDVAGLADAVLVRISSRQGCAVHDDTTVSCWGDVPRNAAPGTGAAGFVRPTRIPGLDRVVDLTVLERLACALRDDGSLWCWGLQHHSEVWHDDHGGGGDPHVEHWQTVSETPFEQLGPGSLRPGLAAGDNHACGLATAGGVRCWSDRETPALHGPRDGSNETLVAVTVADTPWDGHGCLLADSGALGCWGSNREGQLGDGTLQHGPRSLAELGPLTELAPGRGRTCGLDAEGAVLCLGSNEVGALGDGTEQWRHTPAAVALRGRARRLFSGAIHSCVLLEHDAAPSCWGYGFYGQLGVDTQGQSRATPVEVEGLPAGQSVADMALSAETTCALLDDASVYCWGKAPGTRGHDAAQRWLSPVRIDGLGPARQLAAGGDTVCALRDDGSAWCLGALGGTDTPAPVAALDGQLVELAVGASQACARLDDGSVWCWGEDGDVRAIDGLSGPATELAIGGHALCVRTDDGGVWCQDPERLSAGDATLRELPGLPAGPLRAGAEHTCVLAEDTALATCWGSNWSGELGLERVWRRDAAWDGEITR